MKNVYRMFCAAVMAVLFAVTLPACHDKRTAPSGPREKVTIACFKNQLTAGLVIIAKNKGYFDEAGVDVTLQLHDYGKQCLEAMLAGTADLAVSSETPLVHGIIDGTKFSILATIEFSDQNEMILGRRDRGIGTLKDLKGKRIAVINHTSADYMLESMLSSVGLTREEVTLVNIALTDMPDALATGKLDAVAVWNLPLLRMRNQLGADGVLFSDKTLYTEFIVLSTMQDYAGAHPEALRRIMAGLVKAEEYVKQHGDEAIRNIAQTASVDLAEAKQIWGIYDFSVTLNQGLAIAFADEARWALKYHGAPAGGMPNVIDFFNPAPLAAVKPSAVNLIR